MEGGVRLPPDSSVFEVSGVISMIFEQPSLPGKGADSYKPGGGGLGGPGGQGVGVSALGAVTRSAFSCFKRCLLT